MALTLGSKHGNYECEVFLSLFDDNKFQDVLLLS